jgi:flagellar motor protein MotB
MKGFEFVSAATLLLLLGVALPGYAQQDQHDEAKPAQQEEPKPAKPEKPQEAQPSRQEAPKTEQRKEENPPQQQQQQKQEQKREQEQTKHAQDEGKKEQEQPKKMQEEQSKSVQHSEPAGRAPVATGNRGGRVPEEQFRAHFGRQHTFVINRPVIVENRPRFQYSGYWFEIVDAWPAGWAYSDECYIDYIDDSYYLFDPLHPGLRLAVVVVF